MVASGKSSRISLFVSRRQSGDVAFGQILFVRSMSHTSVLRGQEVNEDGQPSVGLNGEVAIGRLDKVASAHAADLAGEESLSAEGGSPELPVGFVAGDLVLVHCNVLNHAGAVDDIVLAVATGQHTRFVQMQCVETIANTPTVQTVGIDVRDGDVCLPWEQRGDVPSILRPDVDDSIALTGGETCAKQVSACSPLPPAVGKSHSLDQIGGMKSH